MSGNSTSILGPLNTQVIPGIEQYFIGLTGLSQTVIDIFLAIAIIFVSYIVAKLSKYVIKNIAPKLVSKTDTSLDDEVFKAINGPLQVFIFVLGIYIAVQTLNDLPPSIFGSIDKFMLISLFFIAAYLLANLVNGLINWYKNDVAPHTGSDLDDVLMPFLSKLVGAIIFVLAGLMALGQFGVEITPLIASLGVAGVAVALASQELLSNLFGAFAILTDRPFKVNDRIQVGDGEVGDVMEIGLRSTRIKTLDSRIIVIPNSDVSKSKVVNYSVPDSIVRFTLPVGISYDSDANKAIEILQDIAKNTEGVLKEKPPYAFVSDLGNFSVNLKLFVWVDDYRRIWEVPDKIYRQTLKRFAAEGIEIPYPVTTVMLDSKSQRSVTMDVFKKDR